MKERILKTLEDKLLIDREYMTDEQIKDIEEQIEAVKGYKQRPLRKLLKKILYQLWKAI